MQKISEAFKQIVKIQYAFLSNITSIKENSDKTATVTFNSGNWVDFESKLYSAEFTENSEDTESGVKYKQILRFAIQGDDISLNSNYHNIADHELIFNLIYEDGSSKILGHSNNPCLLFKDFSSQELDTAHKFYINKEDYRPALYLKD